MLVSHVTRIRILENLRALFGAAPAHLQTAALPWKRSGDALEILLITSRGTGRWVLPKGWPEKGESMAAAAAREAAEEAGIGGRIAPERYGSYFYDKGLPTGLRKRCEVTVFSLEVSSLHDDWPEKADRERRWFTPADAADAVAEPDLGELIRNFETLHENIAA